MKVSKLNEAKLNEIRYKKYVEELKDFCRYGYCLEEETASDYLKFLMKSIRKILDDGKVKEISKETSHKINTNRFDKESNKPNRHDDYFQGKSLMDFEFEFADMFHQLKTQKDDKGKPKLTKDWVEWVQGTFNDYVARFEKRDSSIDNDFEKSDVEWKDKGKSKGKHLPSKAKN